MSALGEMPDVIHIEADHERGAARVWTKSEAPDLDALRTRIAELGFKVTHTHHHKAGEASHDMGDMSGRRR